MAGAVLSGVIALVVATLTSAAGFLLQRERLRQELRTEFMAEQALVALLTHPDWTLRSFAAIRRKVGGFEENDLRQLLIRAGALRFERRDGEEMWGLRRLNEHLLTRQADGEK